MTRAALALVLATSLALGAAAQNLAPRPFPFHWKAVEAAGGYLAEVKGADGVVVASLQVPASQLSVVVPLVPGNYWLKLTTLNRFLSAESDTGWVPIHVAATTAPEVDEFAPVTLKPDQPGHLDLGVRGLADDATASLTSPSGKVITLALGLPQDGRVNLALPGLAERGAYDLVVTNPPVLSTIWHASVVVAYPPPVVEAPLEVSAVVGEALPASAVEGREFSPLVQLWLEGVGGRVPLSVSGATATSVPVVWPDLKSGSYRLMVANGSDGQAVVAGTVVLSDPAPPPANVEVLANHVTVGNSHFVGLAVYRGDYYVTDSAQNRVCQILPTGEVLVLAGTGKPGAQDGEGHQATFSRPSALAAGGTGLLYVVDADTGTIRSLSVASSASVKVATVAHLPSELRGA